MDLGLKKELDWARKMKYNLAVVSVPGMGCSRMLKKYATDNQGIKYINKPGEVLGDFNILDLAFDLYDDALKWADDYFHQAGSGQGIVVAINTPYIFSSEEYKNSFVRGHVYKAYWLKVADIDETVEILSLMKIKCSRKRVDEIWRESGGLRQLIKFEAVGNRDLVEAVVEPILKVVSRCLAADLEKLGLMDKGRIISKLLADQITQIDKNLDIGVAFDLSVTEDGCDFGKKIVQIEANILRKMLSTKGEITKAEVSDIKWGEGKYDRFSDRALNKAMGRLSDKLVRYKIITIPRVGYKIVPKNDD